MFQNGRNLTDFMQIINDITNIPAKFSGAVIALGNFDGLHRGHQIVINKAKQIAKKNGKTLGVACFRPHPSQYFDPDVAPFRLMSARIRAKILSDMGVEVLFEIPFNSDLAAMSDKEFVQKILFADLAVSHVVVGTDFRYGHKKCGNFDSLKEHANSFEIGVTGIEPVSLHKSYGKYGSTEIRNALRDGNVFFAAHMLSRPWIVDGEVMRGDQLGRSLGFPTANLYFGERLRPKAGIYAAECRIEGENIWRKGIAYVGSRPTVDGQDHRLEMHIFDFDRDIYGKILDVAFRTFIRDDIKFDGLDAMIKQMQKDCAGARAIFSIK